MFEPRRPILSSGLPDVSPGAAALDEEARDPLGAGMGALWSGARPHHQHAGVRAAGDPRFDPETTKPSEVIVADVCMPPGSASRGAGERERSGDVFPGRRASERASRVGRRFHRGK